MTKAARLFNLYCDSIREWCQCDDCFLFFNRL